MVDSWSTLIDGLGLRYVLAMNRTLTAIAISGLIAGLSACDDNKAKDGAASSAKAGDKDCCVGKNECKGKGGCASKEHGHSCAGKNDCKGQGGCKHRDCSK